MIQNPNTYHRIVLDTEFSDPTFIDQFKIFAKRKSSDNPWMLYGIEIENKEIEKVVADIQNNLVTEKPYYAHLYNDHNLIIIFKHKVFRVTPHIST